MQISEARFGASLFVEVLYVSKWWYGVGSWLNKLRKEILSGHIAFGVVSLQMTIYKAK